MKIAFFDSGIGGMTVLKEALGLLPHEDYIYYADTAHVPYGTKAKSEVVGFVREAVRFLSEQDIKILVVACNTATSIAINELRKAYKFPIIGMEPAVKPAIERCHNGRILVLATSLTLREEKLNNLITKLDNKRLVDTLPLDGLVSLAEKFQFDGPHVREYLENALRLKKLDQYSVVVLGCTHFVYFRRMISSFFPDGTEIIDGNAGTVRNMKRILEENNLLSQEGNKNLLFYSSGMLVTEPDKISRFQSLLI